MKTNCAGNCNSEDEEKGQPFPENGPLWDNMDLSIEDLKKKLNGETGPLYIYILTTVEKDKHDLSGKTLIQTGSAPNFQGGYMTLCSCKHEMRTGRLPLSWKDVWIAGLTNKAAGNYLFYLMKVKDAYMSQNDIWNTLPQMAQNAKNTRYSMFGDIFEPLKPIGNPLHVYDPTYYHPPCNTHVHAKNGSTEWWCDIDSDEKAKQNKCKGNKYKRKAAMLVGDPALSFIWQATIIKKPDVVMKLNDKDCSTCKNLTRYASGERVCDIKSFLTCIGETNK